MCFCDLPVDAAIIADQGLNRRRAVVVRPCEQHAGACWVVRWVEGAIRGLSPETCLTRCQVEEVGDTTFRLVGALPDRDRWRWCRQRNCSRYAASLRREGREMTRHIARYTDRIVVQCMRVDDTTVDVAFVVPAVQFWNLGVMGQESAIVEADTIARAVYPGAERRPCDLGTVTRVLRTRALEQHLAIEQPDWVVRAAFLSGRVSALRQAPKAVDTFDLTVVCGDEIALARCGPQIVKGLLIRDRSGGNPSLADLVKHKELTVWGQWDNRSEATLPRLHVESLRLGLIDLDPGRAAGRRYLAQSLAPWLAPRLRAELVAFFQDDPETCFAIQHDANYLCDPIHPGAPDPAGEPAKAWAVGLVRERVPMLVQQRLAAALRARRGPPEVVAWVAALSGQGDEG